MGLGHYDHQHPAYFSLQYPIFSHPFVGQSDKHILTALKAIKCIIQQFMAFAYKYGDERDALWDTPIYQRLKEVEFDFFHPRSTNGIRKDIEAIPAEDSRFSERFKDKPEYAKLAFPYDSPFFQGCIRIRPLAKKPTFGHTLTTLCGDAVHISEREYECLKAVVESHATNKEIAKKFDCSFRTIDTHMTHVKMRLGCRNKTDLIKVWNLNA